MSSGLERSGKSKAWNFTHLFSANVGCIESSATQIRIFVIKQMEDVHKL